MRIYYLLLRKKIIFIFIFCDTNCYINNYFYIRPQISSCKEKINGIVW